MHFTTISVGLLAFASSAAAQATTASTAFPTDASAVLSLFYSPIPSITGTALTSFATALISAEQTWYDSPQWTSMAEAIYLAMPKDVQSEVLAGSSYNFYSLTTATWWTAVPTSAQSYLAQETAIAQSVENKFLGTPTSSKNVAPRQTGALAVAAAGVVGVVGVMVAL